MSSLALSKQRHPSVTLDSPLAGCLLQVRLCPCELFSCTALKFAAQTNEARPALFRYALLILDEEPSSRFFFAARGANPSLDFQVDGGGGGCPKKNTPVALFLSLRLSIKLIFAAATFPPPSPFPPARDSWFIRGSGARPINGVPTDSVGQVRRWPI